MCGRPMRVKPLHRYTMEGYDVLYAERMDLHLLKFSTKLMLKPLPEYMLDYDFWESWICNEGEGKSGWWKAAAGWLLSYVWLINTPLDLQLAHDHHIVPKFIEWVWWKQFVSDFMQHVDINALDQVNERYHFGDLRLGRINSVYRTRFFYSHFVRGYLYGYNRYVVFFQRNFSWILIVFVFFSLVLSAMQVCHHLPHSFPFSPAFYTPPSPIYYATSKETLILSITLTSYRLVSVSILHWTATASSAQATYS